MKFIHKNRHFLLMAAGCFVMLIAVFTLTTMTSGGSWGVYLLLLLCPGMHLLMHRGMNGSGNRHEMPHTKLLTPGKKPSVEE